MLTYKVMILRFAKTCICSNQAIMNCVRNQLEIKKLYNLKINLPLKDKRLRMYLKLKKLIY